jgi:hypothetical protein
MAQINADKTFGTKGMRGAFQRPPSDAQLEGNALKHLCISA